MIGKKVLGILTQTHRHTSNNRPFGLIITDQICFVKCVAIKIGVFSSLLSCIRSILFLYLPFTVLSIFFILNFSNKNKYLGNG